MGVNSHETIRADDPPMDHVDKSVDKSGTTGDRMGDNWGMAIALGTTGQVVHRERSGMNERHETPCGLVHRIHRPYYS